MPRNQAPSVLFSAVSPTQRSVSATRMCSTECLQSEAHTLWSALDNADPDPQHRNSEVEWRFKINQDSRPSLDINHDHENLKFALKILVFITKRGERRNREFLVTSRIWQTSSVHTLNHQKPISFAKAWGCIFPSSSHRHQILKEEMMNGHRHKRSKASETQR